MARLSLSLLGPFEVTLDGVPVTAFDSNKVRALLAYLAVEADRPHPREVLAGLLWPDWPDTSARTNLRNALANLRSAIGDREAAPPHLLITRETIQFNRTSDHRLDVAAFRAAVEDEDVDLERLEEALGLYHGPFLQGFAVEDSAAFEEWTSRAREELERLALSALERLAAGYEERGQIGPAIQAARRQVALAPWQESAHRALMRLLALDGQRSAALAQYEACRRALQEELDVAPSAETTRLYERIRDGEIKGAGDRQPEPPHAVRHNLPAQLIPFVGREAALTEIEARLLDPGCRLLTLAGLGGSGKTRLALEVASRQIERFDDGVFYVALAPLQSIEAIVPTMAQALGLTFYGEGEPKEQLLGYLRQRNLLLVLDNFEDLLAGVGIVSEILRRADAVQIVATSRSALNVEGESLYPVSGMEVPPAPVAEPQEPGQELEHVAQYSSVKLFLDHARRARPGFEPTPEDVGHIVRICRLVDGMPLGILLATAWLKVLSPAEIAAEISRNLDLLESTLRDAPERQRSIHAVFDYSWKLLTEHEREVMQALSVFRGGFTRQAASEVADASLRDLMTLVDRSLLHRDAPSRGDRFEMHGLLGRYAAEKLAQSSTATQAAHDRHCATYAAALAQWAADLKGPPQQAALSEIEADIENVRAAWEWAVAQGDLEHLAQGMEGLARFYGWRVRYRDGESAFRIVEERLAGWKEGTSEASVGHLRVRALALAWQGRFCHRLGDTERARRLLQRSLDLLDSSAPADTSRERAFALGVMSSIEYLSGDRARAWQPAEQSLALYRTLGLRWEVAQALVGLGSTAQSLGQYDNAKLLLQEALEILRALGDQRGIVESLRYLGQPLMSQGQFEETERLRRESLAIAREMGDLALTSGELFFLAFTLAFEGEFAESRALLEECLAVTEDLGAGLHWTYLYSVLYIGWTEAHLGHYAQALVYLRRGLTLAQEADESWPIGEAFLDLGLVALAEARYSEGERWLDQSVAVLRVGGPSDVGWPLGALAGAMRGLGRLPEARASLGEALQITAKLRDAFTPMFALPIAALLLADMGQAERAVEVYALASRYGFVANSKLWEDIAGREISALAATLPPDVVAAAQERGRARDLQATVEELLDELIVDERN